jgi:prepilin-type N-terminal cleavage/methylation domain-containing protein
MKRQPNVRIRGLSLIELLIGLAIGALVLAPLLPMLQTANAAARVTGDQVALERDADFALERIAARIRATAPSTALSGASSSWLAPVSYVLSNGTLVERQANTPDLALADSVTDFQLGAPTVIAGRQLIQVSLSLARGDASVTANTTVRMGGMQ